MQKSQKDRRSIVNNLLKNFLWGLLIFPFFISIFCINHFLFWLLFGIYILLIGILLTTLSLFNKLETIEKKLKRYFIRAFTFLGGIGMVVFFSYIWATSYLDIGAYFSKDYKTVKGFSSGHVTARSLFETFEVNNIELKSTYIIPEEDLDKEVEATYLPRSNYVIELWIYR
ncbi:hypothetical protein ACP8HI_04620 [Paenibacillus sp. FA6]|uniref:hypothetical protein n=1 Tax=Paenibacillus sp. FA6 TaxID=3413029 RepID=UPI003F6576D9